MLSNYIKIVWRNIRSGGRYSILNIGSLALGMSCALLISLWVHDELSYDRFLPDVENIYNVRVNYAFKGGPVETAMYTPGPLKEAISRDVPGIVAITKTISSESTLVKALTSSTNEKSAKENGQYVSSDFFDVFEFPALYGNPKIALAQLNQIIISRKLAEKYFSNENALGKTLQLNNQKNYTVGAVLENLPGSSTLQFDWLVNFKSYEEPWMQEWGTNAVLIYTRLKPAVTVAQTEALLKGIYPRYAKFNNQEVPILHPMTDMHLYSEYKNGKIVGGQIEYVRIFSIVALFILLIACINFMNLATARSAVRAKEIGVRKVLGASVASIVTLLSTDFLRLVLIALVLASPLAWWAVHNWLSTFAYQTELTWWIFGLAGALTLVIAFLTVSYQSIKAALMNPITSLRSE